MQVVVAGHICLDIIPQIADVEKEQFFVHLQPGHLIEVGEAAISTGDLVSNTGLALHKLGIPTRLMGKVGADRFGQAVCDIVRSYTPELASGMIIDQESGTSYTIIISPPGVDRIFLHSPGVNHTFSSSDVDYEQVVQADLFHFGYSPLMRLMYENDGLELAEIFRQVNARGTLTSLDLAFPDPSSPAGQVDWRSIFHKVLPYVDIFLPSSEELLFCLDRPRYNKLTWQDNNLLDQVTPELLHALSSELLTMGAKIVVLKLGERGLYLRTADDLHTLGHGIQDNLWSGRELWVPCFQVDVIGTTGSGDATIVGFISGMLRGLDPCETMTIANAVGACNVEAADALSGILAWDETRARVQNGWKRCELHISALGWCYLPELHGWAGSADAENLLAKEI